MTLKNAKTAFTDAAPPRTSLGGFWRSHRPPSRLGRGTPPSHCAPSPCLRGLVLDTFSASFQWTALRCLWLGTNQRLHRRV